jgi:signal transduction histidine kinase
LAKLVVADRGPGIAPEDVPRVFQRFERTDSVHSQGGLGLGLWIAKQLVEAHGGSIDVRTELGSGSTFTVALPLGRHLPASAPAPDEHAPAG